MEPTKEFLLTYGGKAALEIEEQGREQGLEQGRELEREATVMNLRREMGLSAIQISNATKYPLEFVQMTLNKYPNETFHLC